LEEVKIFILKYLDYVRFTSLFVTPICMISYFGQISYLLTNKDQISNVFYASVPTSLFWPIFVIATLSSIIASQSLITSVFSTMSQIMSLKYFPEMKSYENNVHHKGSVYIP
jgi:KUP system potassium uptake protein